MVAGRRGLASFYRTAAGAEINLLLELGGRRGTWAFEDVQPTKAFLVRAGEDRYPISQSVEAIGLREMAGLLSGAMTKSS